MKVNPYLTHFNGQCRAALTFYEKVLQGKVEAVMVVRDTPMAGDMPADWQDNVLHAEIVIGGMTLMCSDGMPGMAEKPQAYAVTINVDSPAEAEKVFAALADGGTVSMPLAATFWSQSFGSLVDRFGTPWMINGPAPA